MFEFSINEEEKPVLVEFAPQPGVRHVGFDVENIEEIAKKSAYALNSAMNTIHTLAEKMTQTVDKISEKPAEVTLEFGLKLDADAGAYIAHAGAEASFLVTLTWKQEEV